jgi:hypothetical protein
MRNRGLVALAVLCFLSVGDQLAWADDVHGVPLPPRAKRLEGDLFASPGGYRATVKFFRIKLAAEGYRFDEKPTEKVRDVTFTRFLSRGDGASWSAVHVVLANGRTTIYILPSS